MELQAYPTDYGTFFYRPGTSDLKAIVEVCDKRGYERRNFRVEPGERWLDLGANVGSFSCYAASKGASSIIAFEPDPVHFEILSKNLKWNSYTNVMAIEAAASNCNGTALFHLNNAKGNTWRNSLIKEWKGGETIEVKTLDIGQYIHPDVCLKIDIEGGELVILWHLMLTDSIKHVKKFVLEWSFDILPNVSDFLAVFKALQQTHKLEGVTENYLDKLSKYETYPPSWFPPCAKIFGVRL